MPGTFARIKVWVSEILTATDQNAEFDNIINNMDPDGIGDASGTTAAMQANADPYPGSTPSLATDLDGELQRLRWKLKDEHKTSQWYISPDIVTKTAAYTATQDNRVILCDATSAAFTVTLPDVTNLNDKVIVIKKIDSSANAITVDGYSSDTIDAVASITIDRQWDFAVLVVGGTGWHIIGGNYDERHVIKKGADVLSATALPLLPDGNYVDVTGATNITSMDTVGLGMVMILHFDGILTITHDATNLVLPNGGDITTTPGDEFIFYEYAVGDWRLIAGSNLVGALDSDVTEVELVNTTTETTVYTYTVPANTLSANKGLRVTVLGDYLNNSGSSHGLTMRVKYGSTTIASEPVGSITTSASRRSVYLQADLMAFNSTSAQAAFARAIVGGVGSVAGSGVGEAFWVNSVHDSIAEDSTGALDLVVTFQHAVAGASISAKAHTVVLEKL